VERLKKPQLLEAAPSHDALISEIICGTSGNIQLSRMNPTIDPITSVTRYASIASESQETANRALLIACFQTLIFLSACAVLEHCDYPIEEIERAMRIRSSKSNAKNLTRLRNGAIWANEVISKMAKGEWTDLSDSIAMLCFSCESFSGAQF